MRLRGPESLALVIDVVHPIDDVLDALLNAPRCNAQPGVVRDLLVATAFGLADGALHRIRHGIGVQYRGSVDVARGPADGLDERALRAQEAFLVGVQHCNERNLRDVESLAQQVDSDQHIELAQAQIANDLDAFHRVDVRVQVANFHPVLIEILGQVLGHALGERGYEHALAKPHPDVDLGEEIVDLGLRGSHFQYRVDQPGRAHDLLHHLSRMLLFVIGGRGRNKDGLWQQSLEFIEAQRTIVERGRESETVVDEIFLSRPVAAVHSTDLRDRDVGLVDECERLRRKVIYERGRRLARRPAGEMSRIVFDPLAETDLEHHLDVEACSLLDALRLDELHLRDEKLFLICQLDFDLFDRVEHLVPPGHVVARRKNREAAQLLSDVTRQRIEELQRFDFVVEEREADRVVGVLGRKDVEHVAVHAERTPTEIRVVALILHLGKALDGLTLGEPVTLPQVKDHAVVFGRITDTVDG